MKKEYAKPKMEKLGNMIKITQGSHSGTNDPGGSQSGKTSNPGNRPSNPGKPENPGRPPHSYK